MDFTKARTINLKRHATLNERWLQERIAEDPSLLGLGDVIVKDVERLQPRAGRLDLLLSDPETGTRYEVEVQLGQSDEAHIIRTIEYWDLERRRFPQYEHVAVLVAEDVTSRFLNVVSLFNGFIPIIAIQLQALEVGDSFTLVATRIVDVLTLATEEEDDAGGATTREDWETKASKASLGIVDSVFTLLSEAGDSTINLKYNRHYVGLARSGVPDNYVIFRPRKAHVIAEFRVPKSESVSELLDEHGLDLLEYSTRWGRYRVRLTAADVTTHRDVIVHLAQIARSGAEE